MTGKRKDMLFEIGGHSVKYILTIVFCMLKIFGVIDWNWIWVISPIILSLIVKVFILLVLSFLVCVAPRWIERWDE